MTPRGAATPISSAARTVMDHPIRIGAVNYLITKPLIIDLSVLYPDVVLLIADRAMRACLPGFSHAFDLGQEWFDWTGLPFVYAFWAVRPGVDLGPVADALREAKRRGLERIGPIAAREAPHLELD